MMNPLRLLVLALMLSAPEDGPIRIDSGPIPVRAQVRHGPARRGPVVRRGIIPRGGPLKRVLGRFLGR